MYIYVCLPHRVHLMKNSLFFVDSPSAPSLATSIVSDLESLNFTISPPIYAFECVLYYVVSTTSRDPNMINDFTIPASRSRQVVFMVMGGYRFCAYIYNFTAIPITRDGSGLSSDVFIQPIVNLTGTDE